MNSPLVNDYKKPLIYRRLLQTLLGGLKIWLPGSTPTYVIVTQLIIFLTGPCLALLFDVLADQAKLSVLMACCCTGIACSSFALFLAILSKCLRKRNYRVTQSVQTSFIEDEEVTSFDGFFSAKTWNFLIPAKQWTPNTLIHPILYGFMWALAVYCIHDGGIARTIDSGLTHKALVALIWISFSVGTYPWLAGSPPEPATFHPLRYDLQDLSRPVHLLTCVLIHYIASLHLNGELNFYLHITVQIIFGVMPFLWLFGILPPIDAYVLWIMEFCVVILYGGSYTSSNCILGLQFLLSTLLVVTVSLSQDILVTITLCSSAGFILSLDLYWILSCGKEEDNSTKRSSGIFSTAWFPMLSFSAILSITLGLNMSHSLCEKQYNNSYNALHMPVLYQNSTISFVGATVVFMGAATFLMLLMQPVYIGGLIRSNIHQKLKPDVQLWFMEGLEYGGALLQLFLVEIYFNANCEQMTISNHMQENIILVTSLLFVHRQIWQHSFRSLHQIGVFMCFEIGIFPGYHYFQWLSPPLRIHLISLLYYWIFGFLHRLKAVALFTFTTSSESKDKKPREMLVIVLSALLFPVTVVLCAGATIFAVPMLPIFTVPLFVVGFPRPRRFWSYPVGYSANKCEDSVYYEQMAQPLLKQIHEKARSGLLGYVEEGDLYLIRWEDKLIWVQVLESGFDYKRYSLKGLEVQETSCHAIEALKIDTILESAFQTKQTINNNLFHTATPLTNVPVITYTDTKNVLTGVIDSIDMNQSLKEHFMKVFLYMAIQYAYTRRKLPGHVEPHSTTYALHTGSTKSITVNKVEEMRSQASLSSKSRLAWFPDSRRESKDIQVESSSESFRSVYRPDIHFSDPPLKNSFQSSVFSPIDIVSPQALNKMNNSYFTTLVENEVQPPLPGMFNHPNGDSLKQSPFKNRYGTISKRKSMVNMRILPETRSPSYNSYLSDVIAPSFDWIENIPYDEHEIDDLQDQFPLSWFQYLIRYFGMLKIKKEALILADENALTFEKDALMKKVLQDEVLEEHYRVLTACCYLICFGNEFQMNSPSRILKNFNGQLSFGPDMQWLQKKKILNELMIKSYRIALKLAFDHTLIGSLNSNWKELQHLIEIYLNDWHIAPEKDSLVRDTEKSWTQAVLEEKPNLFSIDYSSKKGAYTSHMLTLGLCQCKLLKLEREVVYSIWASLVAELLYLTNDDDERYSIQAHQQLLRNISIQAADPPLGYPIYASPSTRMGITWLTERNSHAPEED